MSDFSLEQVSNVLSVTEQRLRYWQRIGLFPRRSEGYDWTDLQRAKLLSRLIEEGVPRHSSGALLSGSRRSLLSRRVASAGGRRGGPCPGGGERAVSPQL